LQSQNHLTLTINTNYEKESIATIIRGQGTGLKRGTEEAQESSKKYGLKKGTQDFTGRDAEISKKG
jgi:hypothetical protein